MEKKPKVLDGECSGHVRNNGGLRLLVPESTDSAGSRKPFGSLSIYLYIINIVVN